MILTSIILPVYNSESYITECINSVLDQTYKNFELVICDDASSDNTYLLLKNFKDPRIRLYRNEKNLGISATLNKLLNLATGQYIAIMNSDDLMMPNRLQLQTDFLLNNRHIDLLGGELKIYYQNNHASKHNYFKKLKTTHHEIAKQLEHSTAIDHITLMAKAEVFKTVKYNELLPAAVDLDFQLRALDAGYKFHNLKEVLCIYRIHNSSTGTIRRDKQLKSAYYAHLHHIERTKFGVEQTDISLVNFTKSDNYFEKFFLDLSSLNREDTVLSRLIRILIAPWSPVGRYCLKRKIIKYLKD